MNIPSLAYMLKQTGEVPYITVGEDVQIAFVSEGNRLYIYFEGSASIADWIHNFSFSKRPYKDMLIPYRVHNGFLDAWKQVEDIVIREVKKIQYKEFIIIGYSHGAALAALCHECVWYHKPECRATLYGFGFGAPRIYAGFKVNAKLRERWNHFFVIRNHTDIVTHLPPVLFGYCHVGHILHIGKGSKYGPIKSHTYEPFYGALRELE